MAETYLRDTHLADRYDISRNSVWRWTRERPDFPDPIKLSPGCVRWRLSEIMEWEKTKEAA